MTPDLAAAVGARRVAADMPEHAATAPVARLVAGERRLAPMRWGMYDGAGPTRRDRPGRKVVRAEELAMPRLWAAPRVLEPCLVLADAFEVERHAGGGLERHAGGGLERFAVTAAAAPKILVLAGVCRPGAGPEGGFAIVTTAANQRLAAIHSRIPAILDPALSEAWLTAKDIGAVAGTLAPCPEERLAVAALPSEAMARGPWARRA